MAKIKIGNVISHFLYCSFMKLMNRKHAIETSWQMSQHNGIDVDTSNDFGRHRWTIMTTIMIWWQKFRSPKRRVYVRFAVEVATGCFFFADEVSRVTLTLNFGFALMYVHSSRRRGWLPEANDFFMYRAVKWVRSWMLFLLLTGLRSREDKVIGP